MRRALLLISLLASSSCSSTSTSSAPDAAGEDVAEEAGPRNDTGLVSDSDSFDSFAAEVATDAALDSVAPFEAGPSDAVSWPPPKIVELYPVHRTTAFAENPYVSVVGLKSAADATALVPQIHLADSAGVPVDFTVTVDFDPGYSFLRLAPSPALSGSYTLRMDALSTGFVWNRGQWTEADGSARADFDTRSAPRFNRLWRCTGTPGFVKLELEYSEKVQPPKSGDVAVQYATPPTSTGCTLMDPGTMPVAGFEMICASLDLARDLRIVAKALTGTAGVNAPAVDAVVPLTIDLGSCKGGWAP